MPDYRIVTYPARICDRLFAYCIMFIQMKKIRWFWDRGDQLYRKTVRITCITFVK